MYLGELTGEVGIYLVDTVTRYACLNTMRTIIMTSSMTLSGRGLI